MLRVAIACRLRRCSCFVSWPPGSNLWRRTANYAETAVELFQRRPRAIEAPPARGPASRRCSPGTMLDWFEPTGQPNGSLSHADQLRGSLAGNPLPSVAARGVLAARDDTALRGGASSQPTSGVNVAAAPKNTPWLCRAARHFCANPNPGQPAPHAAWVERQPGDRAYTKDAVASDRQQ